MAEVQDALERVDTGLASQAALVTRARFRVVYITLMTAFALPLALNLLTNAMDSLKHLWPYFAAATALMLAAGLGHGLGVFAKEYATEPAMLEAVKILVEQHVDVNAANDAGETALHFAALASDPVVKYLADNGANLNAKDRQGRTALDMALGKGGRGRAGEAPKVRDSTVTLLRQLMDTKLSVQ